MVFAIQCIGSLNAIPCLGIGKAMRWLRMGVALAGKSLWLGIGLALAMQWLGIDCRRIGIDSCMVWDTSV